MKNNETSPFKGRVNNSGSNNYNNNNSQSNYNQSNQHDRKKHNPNQHQFNNQHQPYKGQRERSGQRNQYPDSSMSRDIAINSNQVSFKNFPHNHATTELPPISTKPDPSKKFTGRCRLFVGNIPHNTTKEKVKSIFEQYGQVGEIYLGPNSAFAFVKMDTRQNAEAARDALDCKNFESRILRVRLSNAAVIRVKHLSPQVTNELLAYSFGIFGCIERAIVIVDSKGKSTGEGIVEFFAEESAKVAVKRCEKECFILTTPSRPVTAEPFDRDEDEGLAEKSINKYTKEFKDERDTGPRFAERGTFEHTIATRWKELYEIEAQKRAHLEQEIQEARKNLEEQMECSRLDHERMQLTNKLQQLEDDRLKLHHMKEQTMNDAQQREEMMRQQNLLLRQREEEILRRQQLGGPNSSSGQDGSMRYDATLIQNVISSQDRSTSNDDQITPINQEAVPPVSESVQTATLGQVSLVSNQPRTFADATMMGLNPPFIPMHQPMAMMPSPQTNPAQMYPAYMSQPMQMAPGNPPFQAQQPMPGFSMMPQQQQSNSGGIGRQQKFNRPYNNSGNNMVQSSDNSRPRKRSKY